MLKGLSGDDVLGGQFERIERYLLSSGCRGVVFSYPSQAAMCVRDVGLATKASCTKTNQDPEFSGGCVGDVMMMW